MEAFKLILLGLGIWCLVSFTFAALWALFITRYKRLNGIDPYGTADSMLLEAMAAEEANIARARILLG